MSFWQATVATPSIRPSLPGMPEIAGVRPDEAIIAGHRQVRWLS